MREKRPKNSVNGFLLFLIYGVFAMFSLFLVIIGISVYNGVVETGHENAQLRASLFYVSNKTRMSNGDVSIEERDGLSLLKITENGETETYETLIYFYDGTLREHFGIDGDDFDPSDGEKITELSDLQLEERSDGTLKITVTDTNGRQQSISVAGVLSDRGREG